MVARSATSAPGFTAGDKPRVAVASDGTLAAIHEPARIVVVEVPGCAPFSEIGIDPEAEGGDIAWVGAPPRLLVLSRYATHSTGHLLDPYGPRTVAEVRLDAPMRLLAAVGAHALVASTLAGAATTMVLTAGDTQLAAHPFPARAMPVAAGAAGGQFVVALASSIEEWDPQSRLPKRRLKLARAAPVLAIGGSDRVVWMTTQLEPARVEVIPLVNRGQPKVHELPEPIAAIHGHPRSDLLVCIGATSRRIYVVDLDGRQGARVVGPEGIERTDSAGLVNGRLTAVLAAQAHRRVALVPLDGEAAPALGAADAPEQVGEVPTMVQLASPPLAPSAGEPGAAGAGAGEAGAGGYGASPIVAVAPGHGAGAAPSHVSAPPVGPSHGSVRPLSETRAPRAHRGPVLPLETGFGGGTEPDPPPPPPRRAARPSSAPPAPMPAAPRPVTALFAAWRERMSSAQPRRDSDAPWNDPGPSWRDAALAWAEHAARSVAARGTSITTAPPERAPAAMATSEFSAPPGPSAPAPVMPAPELAAIDLLVTRFDLPPQLYPALVYLYAAHLRGTDTPAAELARLLGHRWDEALGRGALAHAGLVEHARGRMRLVSAVLRALDELAPRTGTLVGTPGPVALLGPCAAISTDALEPIAARCLSSIGGAILIAHDDADPRELCLEARAHGAAPLLRLTPELLATIPVDEPLILVVADEATADELGVPRLA